MAKKYKIDPGFYASFTIIGISCHIKDYKMAFNLNSRLGLHMKRGPDFITGLTADQNYQYSFYHFYQELEKRNYFLLSNHNPQSKLLTALRTTDYFLIIDEILNSQTIQTIIANIRQIPSVLTAFEVQQDSLKNIDLFLNDLELHISETL